MIFVLRMLSPFLIGQKTALFSKRGFFEPKNGYVSVELLYKELSFLKKLVLPLYDFKLFKAYYSAKIKKYIAVIDIGGRIKNKLS